MRNDQIFTPPEIVTKMLNMIGYYGDNIRNKTIFEPSFGGGAFLLQIVDRVFAYAEDNHLSNDEIIAILNNVHGIEIDKKWYDHTIQLLTDKVNEHGISYDWHNLICGDTTTIKPTDQYDLCIANPPFIRIHSLHSDEREVIETDFSFGQGNTDLYVIFFELGIKSLKSDGKLCYISPNSFLKNSSQKQFRKYLVDNNMVESIADYGTVPVFGKVATYTAITLLDMAGGRKETKYTMMKDVNAESWTNTIELSKFGEKPWSVASASDETFLKEIASRKTKLSDLCDIQYGLATNADKVYLVDDPSKFESGILRPVIKGSTLAPEQMIIFPYEFDEKEKKFALIGEERLRNEFPKAYAHLMANKEKLEARDIEKGAMWYQYGRSQGIQNSRRPKIALKHVVAETDTQCSVMLGSAQTIVYSGMFITMKNANDTSKVVQALTSEEFCRYVKLVGKNMAGGYKSFNTATVKNFGIKEKESE